MHARQKSVCRPATPRHRLPATELIHHSMFWSGARRRALAPPRLVVAWLAATAAHRPDEGWLQRPMRSRPGERCVYVDLGANIGDSIINFLVGHATTSPKGGHGDGRGTVFKNPTTGSLRRYFHFVGLAGFPIDSSLCTATGAGGASPEEHHGRCRCPHQPNRTNVDVYAIEANPSFAPQLEQMFRDHPNILGMFTKTAVSNESNPVGLRFAVTSNRRRGPSTSSTLVLGHDEYRTVQRQAKAAGESVEIVITPTIDVCSLLRDKARLTPGDHVVVKVDVEAADAMVLNRIATGCGELVDTIAFEGALQGHVLTPTLKSLQIAVRPWA